MAKKRAQAIEVVVAPPVLSPQILLERSIALRQIVQIMRNGAYSQQPNNRPFLPHTGLMQRLRRTYEQNDPEAFLLIVQSYLEQAVKYLPHAGTPEGIPAKMEALHDLIDTIGLQLVGQRILAVIGAPM